MWWNVEREWRGRWRYVTSVFIKHCWAERGDLRPGVCRR